MRTLISLSLFHYSRRPGVGPEIQRDYRELFAIRIKALDPW
jgi:hypothetical protein